LICRTTWNKCWFQLALVKSISGIYLSALRFEGERKMMSDNRKSLCKCVGQCQFNFIFMHAFAQQSRGLKGASLAGRFGS
jgi:hypothetical protein